MMLLSRDETTSCCNRKITWTKTTSTNCTENSMRIQVNLRTHDFNRLFGKLSICHAIFIHHIDICIGKLKAPTWSGQYKLKRSTINVVSSELSLGRLLIIEIALRKVKSFDKMIISFVLSVLLFLLGIYKAYSYMFYRPPNFPPGLQAI